MCAVISRKVGSGESKRGKCRGKSRTSKGIFGSKDVLVHGFYGSQLKEVSAIEVNDQDRVTKNSKVVLFVRCRITTKDNLLNNKQSRFPRLI